MADEKPPGPGSAEGLGEAKHWNSETLLSVEDRNFLIREAERRITDRRQLRATLTWLRDGHRRMRHGRGLAKRWGLTLPSDGGPR